MATIKVSTDIGAPVDVVFARFSDIEHGPRQVSAIKKIELLTPGGFSLGTRWRETREVLGRWDDAEMEVTAFEKNRAYTISHEKGGVRIDATFSFAPIPSGTQVSIEFAMHRSGLPPGLLAPLEWAIAGRVRDALAHDLADLKASTESFIAG